MNILDKTLELLEMVLSSKVSFQDMMNKKIYEANMSSDDILKAKDSLKSCVNRYYFFRWELKPIIKKEYTKHEINLLIVALSYARYVKHVTSKDVARFLKESVEENNYSIDYIQAAKRIDCIYNAPSLLSEEDNANIAKKFSLLFSYPEWLSKKWIYEFGIKKAYKMMAASRKQVPLNLSVNLMKNDLDFLKNDTNYVKGDLASTCYLFYEANRIGENKHYLNKEVFVMDQAEQYLIDLLDLVFGDNVLIHSSSSLLPIAADYKINDFGKVYYSCDDYSKISKVIKRKEEEKINSIITIKTPLNLLITHIPEESQDKVLCMPASSELGLIRRKPEILVTFNKKKQEEIQIKQRQDLEEIHSFVNEGGTLVYAVPTYGKEETTDVVEEFLKKHDDFKLVEERIILPYEHMSEGLYFAKMIKEVEQDD